MSGGPRSLFTMASSHATWISHARDISAVVHEALDQRQLLLASLPPSQLQNRLACGIVVTMLVLFVVTLRYVNVQLPRTTLINDLITAGLLFSQYSIERQENTVGACQRVFVYVINSHSLGAHISRIIRAHRSSRPGVTDHGMALCFLAHGVTTNSDCRGSPKRFG